MARLLYGYLKGMWKKGSVSKAWRKAEGIFIPKVDGAKEVEKFRTISLLNVEGKLFFAMKSERLTKFIMANKYIDESIQKGGETRSIRVFGAYGIVVATDQRSQSRKKGPSGHMVRHR